MHDLLVQSWMAHSQTKPSHIELARDEYEGIRLNAAHFVVLPDHVFPEVETSSRIAGAT